jgi:riboflavin kinase/FMN adenylyltransferase
VYAGWSRDRRAAVSIGTNPHFDGVERRVEAHLLDFDGDLYGERLVVELWGPLREQRRFDSLEELVAAIGDDVARTRAVTRPG